MPVLVLLPLRSAPETERFVIDRPVVFVCASPSSSIESNSPPVHCDPELLCSRERMPNLPVPSVPSAGEPPPPPPPPPPSNPGPIERLVTLPYLGRDLGDVLLSPRSLAPFPPRCPAPEAWPFSTRASLQANCSRAATSCPRLVRLGSRATCPYARLEASSASLVRSLICSTTARAARRAVPAVLSAVWSRSTRGLSCLIELSSACVGGRNCSAKYRTTRLWTWLVARRRSLAARSLCLAYAPTSCLSIDLFTRLTVIQASNSRSNIRCSAW